MVTLLAGCVSANTVEPIDKTDYLIGLHERNDRDELTQILGIDPVETSWCAAYVNHILEAKGFEGTGSLAAKSYLSWGEKVTEPQLGDIVVFDRDPEPWMGHVGFYVDTVIKDDVEYYLILGGNQDNQVSIHEYRADRVVGIRREKNLEITVD